MRVMTLLKIKGLYIKIFTHLIKIANKSKLNFLTELNRCILIN